MDINTAVFISCVMWGCVCALSSVSGFLGCFVPGSSASAEGVAQRGFPIALSGCRSQIRRNLISVGLMRLRALQLSGNSWIKPLIRFSSQVISHVNHVQVM